MSVDNPDNKAFIQRWQAYTKNPKRVSNDPMEAHYIGFNMWVKAVEKAGSFEPTKVIPAMIGVSVPNLSGGFSTIMPNHHITKPVYIGEIQADGQMNTVAADSTCRMSSMGSMSGTQITRPSTQLIT